jgi:hypothetical protein
MAENTIPRPDTAVSCVVCKHKVQECTCAITWTIRKIQLMPTDRLTSVLESAYERVLAEEADLRRAIELELSGR